MRKVLLAAAIIAAAIAGVGLYAYLSGPDYEILDRRSPGPTELVSVSTETTDQSDLEDIAIDVTTENDSFVAFYTPEGAPIGSAIVVMDQDGYEEWKPVLTPAEKRDAVGSELPWVSFEYQREE